MKVHIISLHLAAWIGKLEHRKVNKEPFTGANPTDYQKLPMSPIIIPLLDNQKINWLSKNRGIRLSIIAFKDVFKSLCKLTTKPLPCPLQQVSLGPRC